MTAMYYVVKLLPLIAFGKPPLRLMLSDPVGTGTTTGTTGTGFFLRPV
jgi:hypothetical protein